MSKTQYDDPPAGWTLACHRGWPFEPADDPPWLVQVGNARVPGSFTLSVTPDKRATDSDGVSIGLCYLAENEKVVLNLVLTIGVEVPHALDILRKERSMEWWKRYAFMHMVLGTASETMLINYGPPVDNAWETAMAHTLRDALRIPITSRRKRLTDSHLAKVTEAYRAAWQDGSPPTKAVAEHFHVSHSTAARWVGAARKAGHLGPADSSRGGEQPPTKQPTKGEKS